MSLLIGIVHVSFVAVRLYASTLHPTLPKHNFPIESMQVSTIPSMAPIRIIVQCFHDGGHTTTTQRYWGCRLDYRRSRRCHATKTGKFPMFVNSDSIGEAFENGTSGGNALCIGFETVMMACQLIFESSTSLQQLNFSVTMGINDSLGLQRCG